jgi:hypothetical protein
MLGVSRCRTVERLHRMYRDWESEIEGHERRGEILAALKARKAKLSGEGSAR